MGHLKESRKRLRDYMARHHIAVDNAEKDVPVMLLHTDVVPIRGSVHIATGRTASRTSINRKFRRAKLA